MALDPKSLVPCLALLLTIAPAFCGEMASHHPTEQLEAGQKPSTFAVTYIDTVSFSQQSSFPVKVSIEDLFHKSIASIEVKDSSPFRISVDLVPGSYRILAEDLLGKESLYWPVWDQFFIDPKGVLTYSNGGNALILKKKIELLFPDPKSLGAVTDTQPIFKWQSLEGTVKYRFNCIAIQPDGKTVREAGCSTETSASEYRIPKPLLPNLRYQWSVTAMGSEGNILDGNVLGESACCDFFTPGGREAADQVKKPTSLKAGNPYFGIILIPVHSDAGPNGVIVVSVLPDSPALKAGIVPNDILTSFNGHALANLSQGQFIDLVRKVPVGTQVSIDLLRQNAKQTVKATIEAKP